MFHSDERMSYTKGMVSSTLTLIKGGDSWYIENPFFDVTGSKKVAFDFQLQAYLNTVIVLICFIRLVY